MSGRIIYALAAALLANFVVLVVLPAASSLVWGVPAYDRTVQDVGIRAPTPPPPSWSAWVQSPVSPSATGPGAREASVALGPYSFRPPAGWALALSPEFAILRTNVWSPSRPDGSQAELRVLFAAGNFVPGAPPITTPALMPSLGRPATTASPTLAGPPPFDSGEPSPALVTEALDATWQSAMNHYEGLRKAGARVDFRELDAGERGPALVSFRGLKFAREEGGHVVDGIAYYGPGRNWIVTLEATAVEPNHEAALRAATAALWSLSEEGRH